MKKIPLVFLLVLGLFSAFSNPVTNDPWTFKHEKSGIKVYYRDPGTGIYDLKLVFSVNTTMDAVAALLMDVESYPKWVYRTSEAWRVRTNGPQEMYYYNVTDFPWPMDDRDVVLHSHIKQDEKTKEMISHSSAVEGLIDAKNNRVRMTITDTKWRCNKKNDSEIEIEYTLHSDPAGVLPAWIINLGIDFGPVETVKKFKTKLAEPKYSNAQISFIE